MSYSSDDSDDETVDTSPWNSVVNVFQDMIFLDIKNAVLLDGTYCFNLNIDTPGTKKIVFRIRERIDNEEGVKIEELESVKLDEPESLKIVPVIASPCNLLTRRTENPDPDPENPTTPWSYYVTKRAAEVLEEPEERIKKRPKLEG
ncbi:hypothetical protein DFH29DRAFT_1007396 [Suillus ampliporus]|nr:hypothetical protein DFH29DRAFT_1007396 [Suillus ampliporus]